MTGFLSGFTSAICQKRCGNLLFFHYINLLNIIYKYNGECLDSFFSPAESIPSLVFALIETSKTGKLSAFAMFSRIKST